MVMKIQVVVLWVLTPCGVVGGYQRFGELCCLHPQDVTTQKTTTWKKLLFMTTHPCTIVYM